MFDSHRWTHVYETLATVIADDGPRVTVTYPADARIGDVVAIPSARLSPVVKEVGRRSRANVRKICNAAKHRNLADSGPNRLSDFVDVNRREEMPTQYFDQHKRAAEVDVKIIEGQSPQGTCGIGHPVLSGQPAPARLLSGVPRGQSETCWRGEII